MSEVAVIQHPAKSSRAEIMESVLLKGDLGKLDATERMNYYNAVCQSIGLNPLTRPLEYITLNGKLTLYAKRDCADQLRKINGISIQIVSREVVDDLLTVHVRAKDTTGREDEDFGVVAFPNTLKGEMRANAILKAVTKAKRRVTLSISGLGFLDETEVEDIPANPNTPAKSTSVRQMMRDDIVEMGGLTEQEMRAVYMALLGELKTVPPDELPTWLEQVDDRVRKLPMGWQQTLKRNVAKRLPPDTTDKVVWEETEERPATEEDFR